MYSDEDNTQQSSIIKCIILGDSDVGKSSLVYSYANSLFPANGNPFRRFKVSVTINGEAGYINLELFDTHSLEELKQVNQQSYTPTSIFIVCFSAIDRSSFANVSSTWVPELRRLDPITPLILVATKVDERSRNMRNSVDVYRSMVHRKEGEKLARELGAVRYIETSAFKRVNINKLFRKVISIAQRAPRGKNPKRRCAVL